MNKRDDILTSHNFGASDDRRQVLAPSLDLAKYRPLVEDLGITNEQADEFLRNLWSILQRFVQLGFDVKTIPILLPELIDETSVGSPLELDSGGDTLEV